MTYQNKKVTILSGKTLWECLKEQNIFVTHSCGGKGICGKCQLEVKGIGQVKSCEFCVPGTYEVTLLQNEEFSVVGQTSQLTGNVPNNMLVIGVDLGTTTVAIEAITSEGNLIRSFVNPQRIYGADVMTRIEASLNGMATLLKEEIKNRLYKEIISIIKETSFVNQIEVSVVISGNTTMLHLFRGLSCEGLGKAPFLPVDLELYREDWKVLGQNCQVTYLPGISAFVGGDIVSGIYGLNLMEKEGVSLLLDLGTNGEMALIKNRQIFVASAAAGPAFEGTPLAMKLYAAGIIDKLYFMRAENVIDEYGTLRDAYFEDGYPVEGVSITQEDIRNIQMAKGAIRAGIDILLQEAGVSAQEVEQVYLAGGMGFYLDSEKAVGIGLLPEGFIGRVKVCGNTSLQGALQYGQVMAFGTLQEKKETSQMIKKITDAAKEIVLAQHHAFEEKYIENMNFPEKII